MSNEGIYEPKVGDWVKCVGGTAAVGEVGRILKVTAKRVVVHLFLSQESRNKNKEYVQKIAVPPNEDQLDSKKTSTDDDATEDEENKPPNETSKKSDAPNKSDNVNDIVNGNGNGNVNILITVSEVKDSKTNMETQGLTQENKERFLAAAWDHLQGFSQDKNKPAVDGRGMILRNMRQMIFKTTSPKIASNIVNYYVNHSMSIEGVVCHVSYAEKSVKFDDYPKDGVQKNAEAPFIANTFSSNNKKRFGWTQSNKTYNSDNHYSNNYSNNYGRFGKPSGRSFQYCSSVNKESSALTPPKRSVFNRMKPAKI